MDKEEHSPLPWRYVDSGTSELIYAANDVPVADMLAGQVDANAHLIVTAVNAHAELLNRYADLIEAAKGIQRLLPSGSDDDAYEALAAAIAKSEEHAP